MYKKQILIGSATAALMLLALNANATLLPVGYISWDVNVAGTAGEFDITNLSGPNAAAPDFPVLTQLNLQNLSLTVNFNDGGSEVFGPASGYFSLAPDGESFNGTDIPITGANPLPVSAELSGTFSPTGGISVSGMGTVSILPSFDTTFSDSPVLLDGDFSIIYMQTTGASGGGVPEPDGLALFGLGLFGLSLAARRLNHHPETQEK